MSQLDDLIAEGLAISEEMMGTTDFIFGGQTYKGILNEYAEEQQVEMDGILVSCNATLVCRRPQFSALVGPPQKVFRGKTITIDGLSYSAARVSVDRTSVSLGLIIQR